MDEEFFSSLFTTYQVAPFLIKTLRIAFTTGKFKNSYASFEDFLMQCSRTSAPTTLLILWKLTKYMALSEELLDWSSRLKRFCALLLLFSTKKEPESEQELHASASELAEFYAQVVHKGDATIDCDTDFSSLLESVLLYSPQAARPMQVLMSTIFFQEDLSPTYHPYQPPQCSSESLLLTNFAAGFLAMAGEPLQGAWKCLYTMVHDGIAFNRIVHHVLGYEGPTVVLIKTTHRVGEGDNAKPLVFGVYCHERWREFNQFYGSPKNFLFTISPHFRIYQSARATDNNFQFLASSGFNLPHGMGFGGSLEGFRLFIPDTLEHCTVRASCTTYEQGRLVFSDEIDVSNIQFDIEHLEVWGSGGTELIESGLRAQADHRKVLAHTIDKARKVDKAQSFSNGFDREFLLPNTFSHQKDMQERVEGQFVTTAPAVASDESQVSETDASREQPVVAEASTSLVAVEQHVAAEASASSVAVETLPPHVASVIAAEETTPIPPTPPEKTEPSESCGTDEAPTTEETN
jgi:hypothetical protein